MNTPARNYFFIAIVLFFSCTPNAEKETTATNAITIATAPRIKELPKTSELVTAVDNLRLRDAAGTKGKEVVRLPINTVVLPTGERSEFSDAVTLRGCKYKESWVKITSGESMQGWIFGGALDMKPGQSEFSDELLEERYDHFFAGEGSQILKLNQEFDTIRSQEGVLKYFTKADKLKADFEQAFLREVDIEKLQFNLHWIQQSLPGYELDFIYEATEVGYYLNLEDAKALARNTSGEDDNEVFKWLLKLNHNQPLQIVFGSWMERTTDVGGVSLLGDGIHLDLLKEASAMVDKGNIFESFFIRPHCNEMYADLVKNIWGYKYSRERVMAELGDIITADLSIFSAEEKIQLAARLADIKSGNNEKIIFNERVGRG